ncbi:response regulator transcription factor [Actinosynnema sp. NPDC023587]|uniref:helix-turn-helix transcriptional regulator n=1 Tax=Actinosynnema sp. NPDC023587 TaxID=3154695 RepID=UPI0033FD821D
MDFEPKNGFAPTEHMDEEGVRAAIDAIDKVLAGLQELGDFARRTREGLLAAGRPPRPVYAIRDRSAWPRRRPEEQPRADPGAAEPDRLRLTRRQQQVLDLLTEGSSNRRIARMLHITEQTVKAHLHIVYDKLGAADRTEAVVIAMHRGLVAGGPRQVPGRAAASSASSEPRAVSG